MANCYYVDPADTGNQSKMVRYQYPNAGVTLPDGTLVRPLDETTIAAQPDLWLEGVIDENKPTDTPRNAQDNPLYYFRPSVGPDDPALQEVWTWTGTAVDVQWIWERVHIDQLRDTKEDELRAFLGIHLTNYADTALNPNWKIVLDEPSRIWFGSVSGNLQDRAARQWEAFLAETGDLTASKMAATDPAKGGVENYWPRNIPIAALNVNTGKRIVQDVTRSQWTDIVTDIGLHDFAATDARQSCQEDLNSQTEWVALANINVRDQTYGWPNLYGENGGVAVVGNNTR